MEILTASCLAYYSYYVSTHSLCNAKVLHGLIALVIDCSRPKLHAPLCIQTEGICFMLQQPAQDAPQQEHLPSGKLAAILHVAIDSLAHLGDLISGEIQ